MGARMARNLAAAGLEVYAWNRGAKPELAELGLTLCPNPAAVGEAAPLVISMVTNITAVREVTLGEQGCYATLARHEGGVHISMETIGGAHTRQLAAAAASRGVAVLGAPVSGGSGGAAAGTLAIMASGPRQVYQRCEPLFDILGDPAKRRFCGEDVGQGPDLKLDNNLNLLDGMVTMFLSCIGALAADLEPRVAYDLFLGSTGDSVAMRGRCYLPGAVANNPVDHGFLPIYKLQDALKDLLLWADKAAVIGVPTGRVQHTIDIYREAVRLGYGELDCSAILNVLLARSGRPLLPTVLDGQP